jgi:hypothetical protein
MADAYEKYEKECAKIRAENGLVLTAFASWLGSKGLSEKVIEKHVENVDFYINEFLLYDDAERAADGIHGVGMFLGYWFIKKAMWASPSAIKNNAASLKKFYAYMCERGDVSSDDVASLRDTIREGMPEWVATVRRYDDPDITDMGEVWGM